MFIAIVETAKDSKRAEFKGLPPEYPILCKEYETRDQAVFNHPACRVMTIVEYQAYHEAMQTIKNHIASKKPWWKVWGK